MGKGTKWAAEEDEALATAWVVVSDPANGVNIKSDAFWQAVYERWLSARERGGPARSEKAIKTRWLILTHMVQKFEALLVQAGEQHPEESPHELFGIANKAFMQDQGVLFDRRRVWTILTGCSRWSSNPRSLRKLLRMRKAAAIENVVSSAADKRPRTLAPGAASTTAAIASEDDDAAPHSNGTTPTNGDAPRQAAFASSLQRMTEAQNGGVDVVEDEAVAAIAAVHGGTPTVNGGTGAGGAELTPSSRPLDNYAAALADLARAQREKNELVADQMLMTMLLADSLDVRNRAALEQLKMKYLRRAFAIEERPSPMQ